MVILLSKWENNPHFLVQILPPSFFRQKESNLFVPIFERECECVHVLDHLGWGIVVTVVIVAVAVAVVAVTIAVVVVVVAVTVAAVASAVTAIAVGVAAAVAILSALCVFSQWR